MLQNKVLAISHDNMQKQMNQLAKVTNNMIESINNTKEEWESEISKHYLLMFVLYAVNFTITL